MGFWGSLERYVGERAAKIPPALLVGVGVGVVVISSWWQGKERRVFLEAGASPTPARVGAVIRAVVRKGDYELARELYEMQKVLGVRTEGGGLEEIVYPEKKLRRELEEQKKILQESPYLKTALVNVARIYESLGEKNKAREYWRLVEWVEPEVGDR